MNHAGHDDMPVDNDASVERSYVDWPDDTEVSSIEQLATLLERDVDDIDDWIHGALAEDPGDAHVEHDDESIAFATLGGRVTMWHLAFPFTKDQFDAYMVECDDRTTIAKRGANAARSCAPSAAAYQSRTAETTAAPPAVSHGHPITIPAATTMIAPVRTRIRITWRGRDSSPRRVFSSASVKC